MKTPTLLLLLTLAGAAAGLSSPPQDDERDRLARQLRTRLDELQSVQAERSGAQAAHLAATARDREAVAALVGEKDRLTQINQVQRDEIQSLREALPGPDNDEDRARTFIEEFAAAALPVAERLRRRTQAGIPLEREVRQARIEHFELLLSEPSSLDPEALAELWSWAAEELQLAGNLEFFNEPVVLDGGQRREQAYQLRLGLAQQFAISEDGRWIARAEGEGWTEITEPEQREQLQRALRILQRQEPPSLVPLPVPVGDAEVRPLASFLLSTLLLLAGEADQQTPSADELRQRIEQLDAELDTERAAAAEDEARRSSETQSLIQRRRELAAEVLDLQIEQAKLEAERSGLERQLREDRQREHPYRDLAKALQDGSRNLAERLKIHFAQIPGGEDQAEAMGRQANAAAERPWDDAVRARPMAVLEALDATLEDASRCGPERRTVWTADGRRESVELFSVGQVSWAYRTEDGRYGLALSSPADATGHRWSEELPAATRDALEAAFTAGGSSVSVPVDVSRRLRVEAGLEEESLWQRLRAGGPVMIPLLGVALLALGIVIERILVLFLQNRPNDRLSRQILDACRDGRADEAEKLAEQGRGVVARTLATCIRHRTSSTVVLEDAVQEHLLHEMPRLDRFLGGLASLAAVAPLLGLLGTVTGIINTFGVIRSYGNANPALMAGGISEALVTTATGMAIAVPLVLAQVVLRGRADQTLSDAERHAATLLNLFAVGDAGATGEAADEAPEASSS